MQRFLQTGIEGKLLNSCSECLVNVIGKVRSIGIPGNRRCGSSGVAPPGSPAADSSIRIISVWVYAEMCAERCLGRYEHSKKAAKKTFSCFLAAFYIKSRGATPRRTPVVLHFLSFPKKKGNEAKERNRRQIEIFLCSGVLGCSALPMLTSKETRNFYFHKRYFPRKAARRIRSPLHLTGLQGPPSENFKQAGLLAADFATHKNRKQRPINDRRPPSTRAALRGADFCARSDLQT